jgi:hypothetical protein
MDQDLAQIAISEALTGNWKKALAINKDILKVSPKDVDALNRLARCFAELGEIEQAKKIAAKALKIDPFNTIAAKVLIKWNNAGNDKTICGNSIANETFLEDPGKTKILSLLFLGDSSLISKLDSGDEVKLDSHAHRVSVVTAEGKYIGRLPDDISAKLRKLLDAGNEYQVLIKSIEPEDVKIFIRETKRAKKFNNISSFASEKINYISFTPPELVRKKSPEVPDIEETENN